MLLHVFIQNMIGEHQNVLIVNNNIISWKTGVTNRYKGRLTEVHKRYAM